MTEKDKERVIVFRRLIDGNFSDLNLKSDEDLLLLLNLSVLPNSISTNSLKYNLFIQSIINKTNYEKSVKKNELILSVLSPIEKDLIKFGLYYGFDSYDSDYQYSRFIKHSTKIEIGENIFKKKISINYFNSIFGFIYNLIKKGEANGRFPRT